jgi:hypothetical protein
MVQDQLVKTLQIERNNLENKGCHEEKVTIIVIKVTQKLVLLYDEGNVAPHFGTTILYTNHNETLICTHMFPRCYVLWTLQKAHYIINIVYAR